MKDKNRVTDLDKCWISPGFTDLDKEVGEYIDPNFEYFEGATTARHIYETIAANEPYIEDDNVGRFYRLFVAKQRADEFASFVASIVADNVRKLFPVGRFILKLSLRLICSRETYLFLGASFGILVVGYGAYIVVDKAVDIVTDPAFVRTVVFGAMGIGFLLLLTTQTASLFAARKSTPTSEPKPENSTWHRKGSTAGGSTTIINVGGENNVVETHINNH